MKTAIVDVKNFAKFVSPEYISLLKEAKKKKKNIKVEYNLTIWGIVIKSARLTEEK